MEFNPGQTERILIVYVNGDSDLEPNEDFLVTLSNPTGLTDLTTQNSVILNNPLSHERFIRGSAR